MAAENIILSSQAAKHLGLLRFLWQTQLQQGSGQHAFLAAQRAFSFANRPHRFFGAGQHSGSGAGQQAGSGAGQQTGAGAGAGQQTGSGAGAGQQTGSGAGAGQQTGSGAGQHAGSGAGQHCDALCLAHSFLKRPNPASALGAVAKLAPAIKVKAKIIRTIGKLIS